MALFRLPLLMKSRIRFCKLLGCGKNGTFDIHPDWRQWGIITMQPVATGATVTNRVLYGGFISGWWHFFKCEVYTMLLEPLEGHGKWNGEEVFGQLPRQSGYEGKIAVLTRATIRLSRLKNFWKNVDGVAAKMHRADGFITSVGIGEMPWIRQATFSIWQSKTQMKNFAYKMHEHADVIKKTHKEKWYSEDMFVRFRPLASFGTLHGADPLHAG
ncbi:DUF3291 domain-containing protein [Panacibacter sp. DH6]|uniref:DUF3291 domain-containing protein n=2 Tax=Panacibacter microcysteis TaxID=2793269 RepID=A0A931E8E7_9BACT|nr:DUF3291 domain-containing protein [Panacibacter microcysteis]